MAFTLPDLPYAYDALAPHMSKETLEFHHDKHHNAYLAAMTGMIKDTPYESMSLEDICKKSFKENPKLFNQAGQFYNHVHFWKWMKPNGGGKKLPGKLAAQIDKDLGIFRRLPHGLHPGRHDAVRLRLGVAGAEGRQA